MAPIDIALVDERDSGWECHDPVFRVYLHDAAPGATGGATATYDVRGADALQVIDWAESQVRTTDATTYAVALVRDEWSPGRSDMRRGLVWLVGIDGNTGTALDEREADALARMIARRADPVAVPAADRMPPLR